VNDPVELTVASSEQEAVLICGLLRANGIECEYEPTPITGIEVAYLMTAAGPHVIRVPAEDADRAQELLASAK
jgi:hypothetical protein